MIVGVVTDDYQAVIHLVVRGPAGQEIEIDAIIDTGFDGWLSLPSSAKHKRNVAPSRSARENFPRKHEDKAWPHLVTVEGNSRAVDVC
jgi:predicted aspartyl protease